MQRHTLQCSSRCVYEMKEGSCACPAAPSPNADADADTDCGPLVGYLIRFDSSTVGVDTKIKFMTDGIILREIKLRYSNGFIAVINRDIILIHCWIELYCIDCAMPCHALKGLLQ